MRVVFVCVRARACAQGAEHGRGWCIGGRATLTVRPLTVRPPGEETTFLSLNLSLVAALLSISAA